jgi:hypothetical protein
LSADSLSEHARPQVASRARLKEVLGWSRNDISFNTYDEIAHRSKLRRAAEKREREKTAQRKKSPFVHTRAVGWWHNQRVQKCLEAGNYQGALEAMKAGQQVFGQQTHRPRVSSAGQVRPLSANDYKSCSSLLARAEGVKQELSASQQVREEISLPPRRSAWGGEYSVGSVDGGASLEPVIRESRVARPDWRMGESKEGVPTRAAGGDVSETEGVMDCAWLGVESSRALAELKAKIDYLDLQHKSAMQIQCCYRTFQQVLRYACAVHHSRMSLFISLL